MKLLKKYRKTFIGLLTLIMGGMSLFIMIDRAVPYPVNDIYNYYIANATIETTSSNIVSAIVLNYRVFDTLFEALLLLVAVTAILFIYPEKKKKAVISKDE